MAFPIFGSVSIAERNMPMLGLKAVSGGPSEVAVLIAKAIGGSFQARSNVSSQLGGMFLKQFSATNSTGS